ncbi:MJ0042-type zinc finger domain-containing protein, partial [Pseudomonas syringae]|uniref:MJ0042-type zinc finger domain-containing protein n=1 Tax=Pseudomonas syringae TaxID=317 RepID=UPI003BF5EEC8
MTDSFVTQCPHCQTSFRVSHAQLSVTDSETGLAVRALGDETVGHAAVRLKRRGTGGTPVGVPAHPGGDRGPGQTLPTRSGDISPPLG